jgi:predicted transcriptional regulator
LSIQTDFEAYDEKDWSCSVETYHIKKDEIPGDRERVYKEIAENGGITLKEIADKWGCPPNCISGRITELKARGLIEKTGKKYLPNYKGKVYPHTVWSVK